MQLHKEGSMILQAPQQPIIERAFTMDLKQTQISSLSESIENVEY